MALPNFEFDNVNIRASTLQPEALPFFHQTDYQLQNLFLSSRKHVEHLLKDKGATHIHELSRSLAVERTHHQISICEYYDENKYKLITHIDSPRTLKIFVLNIRSLPKHKGELIAYLGSFLPFDILVFTEIGQKNLDLVQNIFSGYTFHYDPPKDCPRGGVGVYLNNEISNILLHDDIFLKSQCTCAQCIYESLMIDFKFANVNYTLCAVYRHPNGKVTHFVSDMNSLLNQLDTKRSFIWAGDINIDLIKYKESSTLEYCTSLMAMGGMPLISLPTRITDHSATCIDHVFVKPAKDVEITSGILFADLSDHLPTFICIKHSIANNNERPLVRIFGERNCSNFIQEFEKINWRSTFCNSTTLDWHEIYDSNIGPIYDSSFPLRRLSRKRQKDKPWITVGLKISIRHKNSLYRKSLQKPSESRCFRYKEYKNIVDRCIREAEQSYYREVFEEYKGSTRRTWQYLSAMMGKTNNKRPKNIAKVITENGEFTDPDAVSNAFNDYFCSIGKTLADAIPNRGNKFLNYLRNQISSSFYLMPIIEDDVIKIIRKLPTRKAPGPDGIAAKLLKLKPELFAVPLTLIFNQAIERCIYPSKLKVAKVVTIHKKGPTYITGNYRPISLLSIFNKIFEKLIHRQLMSFLEKHKLWYLFQFGFRKLHSTTLAIIEITDMIKKYLDMGNYVFGLFLDLTKAFDTVDHEILLKKMERYGIRGHANDFFRSYLTGRQQYCYINNVASRLRHQSHGVPQGSVLGPLLFLIYINDLPSATTGGELRLFADDTSLFLTGKNLDEIISEAKVNISNLKEWFVCNKLTLNESKTHFCLFHTKNKPIPYNLETIECNEMVIHRCDTVKYIGLMMDEQLNWKNHIDFLLKNIMKYFGIFNNIKGFISKPLARQLFFAFVNSRITYGIEAYGSCSTSNLKKLQIVQNKLLKILTCKHNRFSTNDLHRELNILKISDVYKCSLLNIVHKWKNNNLPLALNNMFSYKTVVRETRQGTSLIIPKFRTTIGSSAVNIQAARLWGMVPEDKSNIINTNTFRRRMAQSFISQYSDI